MQYLILFLEGIITFISPCLLPMLPVYVSYFAGGEKENKKGKTLTNALGFVAGFTVVFMLMGALAGTVGSFLKEYQTAVNIISGLIVVFFGLNYLGLFKLNIFKGASKNRLSENSSDFSHPYFSEQFSQSAGLLAWEHSSVPHLCLHHSRDNRSPGCLCCFAIHSVLAFRLLQAQSSSIS